MTKMMTRALLAGAALLPSLAVAQDMTGMDHSGHDMAAMDHGSHAMTMTGLLGPYPMSREASGTAWQPDSAGHDGVHFAVGNWSLMAHGNATLVVDDQGGARGGRKTFSESMAMLMGSRKLGDSDTLALRAMVSLDALMGRRGYPLLFATGETADGATGLVDRQHPHDLFMELAASWSRDLGGGRAVSLYAGLPGEPALGPPTFMHRVSGMDNPEAPISHHWFDSTHITFGVVTAGYSTAAWKFEASAFKGREPDQRRWNLESPKLDSWSVRAFWNPTADLSLQASTGHLNSPEQLHPEKDEQRTTLSATWAKPLGDKRLLAATLAWSNKDLRPGPTLTAWLAEGALKLGPDTVFARAERKQDDELFENQPASPLHEVPVTVNKVSLGYFRTLPVAANVKLDVGGLASAYAYPTALETAYGKDGVKSFMLFARVKLGS